MTLAKRAAVDIIAARCTFTTLGRVSLAESTIVIARSVSRARAGEEHYEFSKLGNQREARDHQCAPRDPQWTGTVGLKPNQSKMVDHN